MVGVRPTLIKGIIGIKVLYTHLSIDNAYISWSMEMARPIGIMVMSYFLNLEKNINGEEIIVIIIASAKLARIKINSVIFPPI